MIKMQERNISVDEIYEVFQHDLLALDKKETIIIGQTGKGKIVTLVMDLKKGTLITLWPASRRQRKLFKQKIKEVKNEKENPEI